MVHINFHAYFLSYMYLYKLSYMYSVVIGFLLTYLIGYVTSEVLRFFNLQGPETIYKDADCRVVNEDLFMSPFSRDNQKTSLFVLQINQVSNCIELKFKN